MYVCAISTQVGGVNVIYLANYVCFRMKSPQLECVGGRRCVCAINAEVAAENGIDLADYILFSDV